MKDAACNGMVAYKFRFSTGSTVEGGATTTQPPAQATSTSRPVETTPTTKPTTPASIPTTAPVNTNAPVVPTPTKPTSTTPVPNTPLPVNTPPQLGQQSQALQLVTLLIQLLQAIMLKSDNITITSTQIDLQATRSFNLLSKKINQRALKSFSKERALINSALYQYKACKKINVKTKQVSCAKNSLKYLLKAQKGLSNKKPKNAHLG